jgi:hypothetical protein
MALDKDKIALIEQIQEESINQRNRLVDSFIPDNPKAKPFPAQIAFLKDKSLSKLARCGNRAAKTFTAMRDLAWKLTKTHWYRQDYNVFQIHDKRWMEKAKTVELETRYFRTKSEIHWIVGPTYEFVNGVMWTQYLEKMIPAWYIMDIKKTNQGNIESVIFKNGDVLKFKTYAQQETTKMGFAVNSVYIDEMPSDYQTITELIVRTFDLDGSITLSFTSLVENDDIVKYLDSSCNSGTMSFHNWGIYDNPHYSENPERMKRVLAEYANMPENERNARLYGTWFVKTPDKAVFEGIEPEIVRDFPIPETWRRVRYTDPASHVTGHCEFAEDPATGEWYCYLAKELTWGHIVKASDIMDAIEKFKPFPSYRYHESVYDNAEAWFGAETKNKGYRSCILKNREAAIMATRESVGSKRVKFFETGAALLLVQLREYKFKKDGFGVVKKKDHMLDCLMYFSREIPKRIPVNPDYQTLMQQAIANIHANAENIPKKQHFVKTLHTPFFSRLPVYRRGVR